MAAKADQSEQTGPLGGPQTQAPGQAGDVELTASLFAQKTLSLRQMTSPSSGEHHLIVTDVLAIYRKVPKHFKGVRKKKNRLVLLNISNYRQP